MENNIKYLKSSLNDEIAYCHDDMASDTSIFFFGGYSSDMTGTKATALSNWSMENKYNFTRFDYSGHGKSGGNFEEGGITKWSVEANEIFQKFQNKQNIIIGSSMGGWISLIVAKKNTETIHGLVGIASAPDFVVGEWNRLSKEQKDKIKKEGKIVINWDDYEEDYIITYKFLEDGMKNMLLKDTIPITCPIRLLHGKLDKVISTSVSQTIIEKIESKNKDLVIIDDGDHSLSRQSDLNLLFKKIEELI